MQIIRCPRCELALEVTASLPSGFIADPVDHAEIGAIPVDWRTKCVDQVALTVAQCSHLRPVIRAAIIAGHGRL